MLCVLYECVGGGRERERERAVICLLSLFFQLHFMFILGCFFLGVDVLHGNFAGLKHVHFQESFN